MKKNFIRITLVGIMGLIASAQAMAQMNDPREKFSMSAAVMGSPNSDYTWKSPDGAWIADGRSSRDVRANVRANVKLLKIKQLSVYLSPFYNFSNQRLDTEWGNAALAFDLPSTHHHFGSSLMVTYQLNAWGKPLMLMGSGTGNFSQYGLENAQGMLGGTFTLVRTRNKFFSLGAVYLLGAAVVWPLYPTFIYMNKINNRWSLNCMMVNNYLYYHASPALKYSLGLELQADKYYFRPDVEGLPDKAQISQLSERVGLFADWQTTKSIGLNVGMGVAVPFFCRLQKSGYNESFMTLRSNVKPFVRMKAKLSIFRQ